LFFVIAKVKMDNLILSGIHHPNVQLQFYVVSLHCEHSVKVTIRLVFVLNLVSVQQEVYRWKLNLVFSTRIRKHLLALEKLRENFKFVIGFSVKV